MITGSKYAHSYSLSFGVPAKERAQLRGEATIIASGSNNYIAGAAHGGIFSGQCNCFSGDWGAIAGGLCNKLTVKHGFIGGGCGNTVSGYYSAILGGGGNNVAAAYQYAGVFGQNVNAVMSNALHVENLNLNNMPSVAVGATLPPLGAVPGTLFYMACVGTICPVFVA